METFKTVKGVPTKVVCFGKHVDDELDAVTFLILVFPGNPGVVDYYREFMAELHSGISEKYPDQEIPVWGISHAGHQRDDLAKHLFPPLKENENLYSLEGQVVHKFEFIKKYIPNHIKLIGIGHSIGCKAWSEVIRKIESAGAEVDLQENNKKSLPLVPEIAQCFMLFPTLERMRSTPNGKWFTSLLPYYAFFEPLLKLVTMLPTSFHRLFLKVYFFGKAVPESVQQASLHLFKLDVYQKVLHMAKCEMEHVWDLDVDTLQSSLDKLFFYFSKIDGWVPLEFVNDMKVKLPSMKFQICEQGVEHAFVINHSVFVAKTVCSLVDVTVK